MKKCDEYFPKTFMLLSVIICTHDLFIIKVTERNIAPLYMKRNAVLVLFDNSILHISF